MDEIESKAAYRAALAYGIESGFLSDQEIVAVAFCLGEFNKVVDVQRYCVSWINAGFKSTILNYIAGWRGVIMVELREDLYEDTFQALLSAREADAFGLEAYDE